MDIVDLSKIKKQLKKVPFEVRIKLQQWVLFIEEKGLFEAQKFPGFRDHSLKGDRKGQKSVYLTKKWRLIYTINSDGEVNLIVIQEVMPHDY
jgi:proteic killer suppression protein